MQIAELEARFSTLVMAVVEEMATPAELTEFRALLRDHPEFKFQYLEQIRIHALMCQRRERPASVPLAEEGKAQATERRGLDWGRLALKLGAVAAAAALFVAAGVAIEQQRAAEEPRSSSGGPAEQGVIEIVRHAGVSGLDVPAALPGALRLSTGHISVRLKSGVELQVLGPADMLVTGSMDVRLRTGRLLAHVPPKARGFMVQTPELELWDMGTRFGVSASEGMSDVFVFQGSVQVNESSGEAVDLCLEGEGVRAIRGERPLKFAADWKDAEKLLASVQGRALTREPEKTLKTAEMIADLWAERYMPRLAKDEWLAAGKRAAWDRRGRFVGAVTRPVEGDVAFGKRPRAPKSAGDGSGSVAKPAVKAAPDQIAETGSVIDFRNAVRREDSLIHLYTFEGPQADSAALRLMARAGSAHLVECFSDNNLPPLAYDKGYDALSYAGVSVAGTNNANCGRAWTTGAAITLPREMTVECVVSPTAIPQFHSGSVIAARASENQRGYFVWLRPTGTFETRVGNAAARTIASHVISGHWYYIANTYAFDGTRTTINSYYADLTAGTPLRHTVMDAVVEGGYGDSAVLGIGVLPNLWGNLQYFTSCAFDEVAFYTGVHDFETINSRFDTMRRPSPSVAYREIFPNDNNPELGFPCAGWQAHYGPSAVHTRAIRIPAYGTAFKEAVPAVASDPQDTGAVYGYLNNCGGPTCPSYLYWTDEVAGATDIGDLRLITFDARFRSGYTVRAALRVDSAGTPQTDDDLWFVSADCADIPGTGALTVPTSADEWHWHWLDVREAGWRPLAFLPGIVLEIGDVPTLLPGQGRITACGLFQDTHTFRYNARYDNFTLYAGRPVETMNVTGAPRWSGTVIRVQ